jgi:hypothetical protein
VRQVRPGRWLRKREGLCIRRISRRGVTHDHALLALTLRQKIGRPRENRGTQ